MRGLAVLLAACAPGPRDRGAMCDVRTDVFCIDRPARLVRPAVGPFFPSTTIGLVRTDVVIVTNAGEDESGTLALTTTGDPAFTARTDCTSIGGGEMCAIEVSFAPTHTGEIGTELAIAATPGGTVTVGLGARAVPANVMAIAPTPMDFGGQHVGIASPQLVATVTNTASVPTGALHASVTRSTFAIRADTCTDQTVGAGGTCTVAVDFTAATTGADGGVLVIDGDPGGLVRTTLAAFGVP